MAHNHEVVGSNPSSATMKDDKYLSTLVADTLIERPEWFFVGGQQFCFYPTTLGKSMVLSDLISQLNIDKDMMKINTSFELARLVITQEDIVLKIIVISTLSERKDIINESLIKKRVDFFRENLDCTEKTTLFGVCLDDDKTKVLQDYLGITEENFWKHKAINAKQTDSSISFGGKSIYGSLIDFCCERYGWTMDYVLWGVSYINLKMLMSDYPTNIYLSDEERKKIHIPQDRSRLDGENIDNIRLFMGSNL